MRAVVAALVGLLAAVGGHHHHRKQRPMLRARASWYWDAGQTASGWHAFYGVANRTVSFGTRVRFCYPPGSSHCLTATVDDRGPFVGGRDWDLNQTVARALGFSGVQTVGYRVGE